MAAVDANVPLPVRDIDNVCHAHRRHFLISGRGTVVTEESNAARSRPRKKGNRGLSRDAEESGHRAWRCSRSFSTKASRATTSALLRGTEKDDVERGQVSASRVDHAHTKFKAEAYVLTKEEGGRHTPFFSGYRPHSTSAPRRHRRHEAAAGRGNGHAGDNGAVKSRDHAVALREEACASLSAKAPHRRRRRRRGDHRVTP